MKLALFILAIWLEILDFVEFLMTSLGILTGIGLT